MGMTPQHFHTIPTSCAIMPPLTQVCFVFVVSYLSVYYVVSFTRPSSTWYMCVVFYTDDCGVLCYCVCKVWVMYWVSIR